MKLKQEEINIVSRTTSSNETELGITPTPTPPAKKSPTPGLY